MEKKLYEIIHYTYGDVCGDDYYGKKSEVVTDDIVFDTEEAVSKAVDLLNEHNRSYHSEEEPAYEFDRCWMDEDYYYYREVKPEPLVDLLKRYHAI